MQSNNIPSPIIDAQALEARSFTNDLRTIVNYYKEHSTSLHQVEALVLAQCDVFLILDANFRGLVPVTSTQMQNIKKEEGHDLS